MNVQDRRAFIKKAISAYLFVELFPKISFGGGINELVKNKTPGITSPSLSFNWGSARDITRDTSFFFRDKENRYVLFRGVNWGSRSKAPPYLPDYPLSAITLSEHGNKSEITKAGAIMKSMGFNIVRLCVMWKGFEPVSLKDASSELDDNGKKYLDEVYTIVDELYNLGIFVIIDFHQDIAHELYGGDGFPDWAICETDKNPPPKIPKNYLDWALNYYGFSGMMPHSHLVRNTLQSFWNNNLTNAEKGIKDFKVQDHLLNVIEQVSKYFIRHPGVLGYEPFNEPQQVGWGKEYFEKNVLTPFYEKSITRVRNSDPNAFLFLEPRVDWNSLCADKPDPKHPYNLISMRINEKEYKNNPAKEENRKKQIHSFLNINGNNSDSRLIFSFHFYDPYIVGLNGTSMEKWIDKKLTSDFSMKNRKRDWHNLFEIFMKEGTDKNLMPFLTEFGGDQKWLQAPCDIDNPVYENKLLPAYQDLLFQQIEANMLNATYWDFNLYATKDYGDNWNGENFSIISYNGAHLQEEIIVRPYPMRSSAQPVFMNFNVENKHFVLMMKGAPVPAPTVIFVPNIQYPQEFEIHSTSVRADLQWDSKEQLLYWVPDNNQIFHTLIICPAGCFSNFDPDILPEDTQVLFKKCKQVSFTQIDN